ncbi:uncharacterized protein TNCV_250821 [Trichonephila clavipes]|nr:uncharacterized protein TNCV_250821 [Trichonephila clavipes]
MVSSQNSLEDENLLCFLMKTGSALLRVMVMCFVRRQPSEGLQPNCLQTRHTGLTPGIIVWRAISYDTRSTLVAIPNTLTAYLEESLVILPIDLPFINSNKGGVSQQDNAHPLTIVVTQPSLESADL